MPISIIAAIAKNGIIGTNNRLPWHLSSDLKRFKKLTLGKNIVMGRKTYQSIGRALPNRTNFILTTQPNYSAPDCKTIHTLEDIHQLNKQHEIMVIGGATLYKQLLPQATHLYLTTVDATPDGDTYFPVWSQETWKITQQTSYPADHNNDHNYQFTDYERQ